MPYDISDFKHGRRDPLDTRWPQVKRCHRAKRARRGVKCYPLSVLTVTYARYSVRVATHSADAEKFKIHT